MKNPIPYKTIISLLVSFGVLGILLSRVGSDQVWAALERINPLWLIGALAVSGLAVLIRTLRWQLILNRMTDQTWSIRTLLPLTLTGISLSLVIPAGMGEVGRAYFGVIHYGHREAMISSSLLDKWVGVLGAMVLGLFASLIGGYAQLAWIALAAVILLTAAAGLIWTLPMKRWVCFRDQIHLSMSHLFVLLFFSIGGWLATYLQLFLLYLGLGASIGISKVYGASSLLTLSNFVPFTWAGMGARDVTATLLFQEMGIAANTTVAACLLFNVTAILLPASLGAIAMLLLRRKQSERQAASHSDSNPMAAQ
jgi:uncharacterized membrane protein YbhN (UPF0104 family)